MAYVDMGYELSSDCRAEELAVHRRRLSGQGDDDLRRMWLFVVILGPQSQIIALPANAEQSNETREFLYVGMECELVDASHWFPLSFLLW